MRRRSILAMLGIAPVVAASGGPVPTPASSLGMLNIGSAMRFDEPSEVLNAAPSVSSGMTDIARAKARLEYLKWMRSSGWEDTRSPMRFQSHNIESRKATSPAVKALLQREHEKRMELVEAEGDLHNMTLRQFMPKMFRDF